MNYRVLGRTGLRCSEIGLGTWAFSSGVYGPVKEEDAAAAIDTAIAAGINFFDTAPLYGNSERDGIAEEVLGRALRAHSRESVLISTKFGRNPTDGNRPNFHADRARQSVEASLQRLGTDRLDVLFFHSPFSPNEIHDDVWDALADLKKQGKVRFIGHSISAFAATEQMARSWAKERKIDVVQVVYSLLNREASDLIHDLGEQGIAIVARESLANGFLSGKVGRDTVFPPNTLNARYSRQEIAERVEQVERLSFLVRGDIQSMPQAALRWVLDNPHVSLVLTGAKDPQEVRDCAAASNVPSYAPEELSRAEAQHTKDFAAA